MKVFLVRHAESKANALNIHGGEDTELSDNGVKQAEAVAKRFVGVGVDVILCSKYVRSIQTAKIINGVVEADIVYNELLGEWRWPSELLGKVISKEDTKRVLDRQYENADNPKWHYSDEENVFDVLERAKRLLSYKSRKEESVMLVMHGAFMGAFLGLCLFGEGISGQELRKSTRFFSFAANTGITELVIDKEGVVKLLTFNDYTHIK